jgi:hypothetical protein
MKLATPALRLEARFARCTSMPSAVIRRFDYRPESRELEILFTTGRRYIYSNVPEEVARRFRAAFAKGSYFNRQIRDRYPYREIDSVS